MAQAIADELLLLIYRPDGGARGKGVKLDLTLAGALLTELVLDGYVELEGKKLKSTGRPDLPTHPQLAHALALIAKKPRTPESYMTKVGKRIRRRLLNDLVTAGVLTKGPGILGVFPNIRFPEADPWPRDEVRRRLRAVVIEGREPDQRTAALASLIHTGGLATRVFPDEDKRAVKARLRELADSGWTSDAVKKAIIAAIASKAIGYAIMATSSAISISNSGGD